MQISPAGLGPPDPVGPSRPVGVPGPSGQQHAGTPPAGLTQDNVATLLTLLATPEIGNLVSGIDQSLFTGDQVATEKILQSAIAAVAEGNYPVALAKVTELLTVNPEHAETVPSNPSLHPIQGEMVSLVRDLKVVARLDASDRMAAANHAIANANPQPPSPQDLDPRMLLVLAMQFYDTDRLIGYRRSAEIARKAAVLCGPGRREKEATKDTIEQIRLLWSRAPLLVLLAAWFAFGWLAGVTIWALGFLALVGFHFVWRIRNIKL